MLHAKLTQTVVQFSAVSHNSANQPIGWGGGTGKFDKGNTKTHVKGRMAFIISNLPVAVVEIVSDIVPVYLECEPYSGAAVCASTDMELGTNFTQFG